MFDLSIFFSAAVAGVPLLFVVLGLVQWAKEMGLEGKITTRLVSMGIGLFFGGGYMIADQGWPGWVFAPLFMIFVYGVGMGLIASGIYDVGAELLRKKNG